ncbi:fibrillarin-like rRNA/tRNA 2'-O-methyltransferase [[Eubacterium] cellulosolvens]
MVEVEVHEHEIFPNVFLVKARGQEKLATKNMVPGTSVYGEELVQFNDIEYRIWDPYRSKLAAAIKKGLHELPIKQGGRTLYLGAASGTTVSHVSDIKGDTGEVYAVEFSQRSMRDLIEKVCRDRSNVRPILADARIPAEYRLLVYTVDSIYCDVAQPEQAKLLSDNADVYLKKKGRALLAVKSRSIDVTQRPADIFKKEIKILEQRGFHIYQVIRLEPFDKDHAMIILGR